MTRLTLRWHLKAIQSGVPDGAYTTSFTEDGRVCDAYDIRAAEVLGSDCIVKYLDSIANDPMRRYQERYDAARLLDHHIWPDAPDSGIHERSESLLGHVDRPDIEFSEWTDADFVNSSRPSYNPTTCYNDKCSEGGCLCDPDHLRENGNVRCMVCDTEQPVPDYPS